MLPTSCIHPLVTRTIVISSFCNQTHVCWGLKHRRTPLVNYSSGWIWTGVVAKIQQNFLRNNKTFIAISDLAVLGLPDWLWYNSSRCTRTVAWQSNWQSIRIPTQGVSGRQKLFFTGKPRVITVPNMYDCHFLFWSLSISHVFARICTCNRTSAIA